MVIQGISDLWLLRHENFSFSGPDVPRLNTRDSNIAQVTLWIKLCMHACMPSLRCLGTWFWNSIRNIGRLLDTTSEFKIYCYKLSLFIRWAISVIFYLVFFDVSMKSAGAMQPP